MNTQIATTDRHFAAIRAHRTRVANLLRRTKKADKRAELTAMLVGYDAELATAPVKPAKAPADRHLAAQKAWRTMWTRKLKGTRGKTRAALKAKIEQLQLDVAA